MRPATTALVSLVGLAVVLGRAPFAAAQVERSGWVPNVGILVGGEGPLGDMYTFACPVGGVVFATVDTKDDTDDLAAGVGSSCIDPLLFILDGLGAIIAFADDVFACTHPQVCAFACPAVGPVLCGAAGAHSIIVRDQGPGGCNKGGGYDLFMSVFDVNGNLLDEKKTKLGGGAKRKLPKFLLPPLTPTGFGKNGPALDDEDVPL